MIILLLVGIVSAMQKITAEADYINNDFLVFWLAGHANWADIDPYASADWVAARYHFGAKTVPEPEFLYPLPLSVLLAPLGLLPLRQAFFIWGVISAVLIVFSFYLLLKIRKNEEKITYLALPLLLLAPLYPPVLLTLYLGQLSAFLFLFATLAVYHLHKKNFFWGGFFIALFTLKPSIGLTLLFFTSLWLLQKKQLRAFGGMLASSLLLLGIGLLRDPHWVTRFLAISNNKMNNTFGYSPTVWGLAGLACRFQPTCTLRLGFLAFLLVSALTLWLFLRWKPNAPALEFSVILALSLLTAPYLWPYDQLLLFIPILLSLTTMLKNGTSLITVTLIYLGIAFFVIGLGATANILGHQHENLYLFFSLLIWGFSLSVLKTDLKHRHLSPSEAQQPRYDAFLGG